MSTFFPWECNSSIIAKSSGVTISAVLWDLHSWCAFEVIKIYENVFCCNFRVSCVYDDTLHFGSFGIQSSILFASGFVFVVRLLFFFGIQTRTVTKMSTARACVPHQAGFSKLLSWVFRKGTDQRQRDTIEILSILKALWGFLMMPVPSQKSAQINFNSVKRQISADRMVQRALHIASSMLDYRPGLRHITHSCQHWPIFTKPA